MPYSFIGNVAAGSIDGSGFTTPPIDTSGADLLVMAVSSWTFVTSTTISDSYGNTWERLIGDVLHPDALTDSGAGIQAFLHLYQATNPIVGPGHTFTVGPPFPAFHFMPAMSVLAFAGSKPTTPFNSYTSHEGVGQASAQAGSITPSKNDSLILSFVATGEQNRAFVPGAFEHDSTTYTIDSGFTQTDYVPGYFQGDATGRICYGLGSAYLIQGAAAPVDPIWTSSPAAPPLPGNGPVVNMTYFVRGKSYIVGKSRAQLGFALV